MDILHKTLSEMQATFTSVEFMAKAKTYGLTRTESNGRTLRAFLLQNATLVEGHKKMWSKKPIVPIFNADHRVPAGAIERAIAVLKKAGYKIMKPTSDWTEV